MHWILRVTSLLIALLVASNAAAETRYVDRDAPQNGDGLAWGSAYRSLRGALNEAQGNLDITEIWVADGTYQTNGNPFDLRDGLSFYGGFTGTETERNDRDPFANRVIVDGGNTTEIFNEGNLHDLLFDGLRFRNCVTDRAGAVVSFYSGSMTFVNCVFSNCRSTGTPNNPPSGGGGAVGGYEAPDGLRFINCIFRNNQAYSRGGAVHRYTGVLELTGCLFLDNRTTNREGGAFYTYEAETAVNNCTIVGNTAGNVGGAINNYTSSITMRNTILWSNSGECGLVTGCPIGINWYWWPPEGNPVVSYTISPLADLIGGVRHIDENPRFIDLETDWAPFALSPAIDAADNTRVPRDTWDVDRDGDTFERLPLDCLGNPRFVDAGPAPNTGNWENPFGEPLSDLGAVEFQDDCNDNGIPDLVDTAGGSSEDCDGNGLPDECELDCDGDGVADACAILDGLVPDCNGNGIPDSCDVQPSGDSGDIDENGVPDECEDCNNNRLPDSLDVRPSGQSEDCNDDGVPDECQLGLKEVAPYRVHDGRAENGIGTGQQGWIAWMQRFVAEEHRSSIRRIGIDFAAGVASQQVRIVLWDDPNGDGSPTDAVPLRQRNGVVTQPAITDEQYFVFDPPIEVEPGSSFFIGVYMVLGENWYPAAFDESGSDAGSWVAFAPEAFELDAIGDVELLTTLPGAGFSGRWVITGDPVFTGGEFDSNENGIPDVCDFPPCPGDLDGDGEVGGSDLGLLFVQWGGPGTADLDGDGSVGGADLGLLFIGWGDCP